MNDFVLSQTQEQKWGECETREEEGFEHWVAHLVDF
jgi:hypothetical protein